MSKALPIAVAILLGGAALAPVYYASKTPANSQALTTVAVKEGQNSEVLNKLSYANGYQMASQIPAEVNVNALVAGLLDAKSEKPSKYSEAEIKSATVLLNKELYAKGMDELRANLASIPAEQKAEAEQALAAYDANTKFLKENAKKEGVITTDSGLQYKITKQGTGKQPTAESTVLVHYKGTLIDGTVFDSSLESGKPVEFPLNQVVAGWTEGFQHLKEGAKATLYIPAYLGYGEQNQGPIPGFSTLIFDVELVQVK